MVESVLILCVFGFALQLFHLGIRSLNINFTYEHVLFGGDQPGLKLLNLVLGRSHPILSSSKRPLHLPDLVLVGAPIELEQRVTLLNRHVWLHKNGCDEGWFRESRDQLNGVLNHASIGRVRGRETQADHKYQQNVDPKKGAHYAPSDAEFQELQLEKDQPDCRREYNQQEKRCNHLRFLLSLRSRFRELVLGLVRLCRLRGLAFAFESGDLFS